MLPMGGGFEGFGGTMQQPEGSANTEYLGTTRPGPHAYPVPQNANASGDSGTYFGSNHNNSYHDQSWPHSQDRLSVRQIKQLQRTQAYREQKAEQREQRERESQIILQQHYEQLQYQQEQLEGVSAPNFDWSDAGSSHGGSQYDPSLKLDQRLVPGTGTTRGIPSSDAYAKTAEIPFR